MTDADIAALAAEGLAPVIRWAVLRAIDTVPSLTVERVLVFADAWLDLTIEMSLLEWEISQRRRGVLTDDALADAIAGMRDASRQGRRDALAALVPQIEAALTEPW